MPDPMTTPGRQAARSAAYREVGQRFAGSVAVLVRERIVQTAIDAYERVLAEQPREEREDDLLRVECEKRGLPVDLATLLRHIENNHAATRGAMQDQIDNWKSRAEQPRGEEERGLVEGVAEALWAWSWTVDQQKTMKPYPYERLIDATKDDLRAAARRVLRTSDEHEHALVEIAAIQADCEQAKWMRNRAATALAVLNAEEHPDA